jgi:hypothetical protein
MQISPVSTHKAPETTPVKPVEHKNMAEKAKPAPKPQADNVQLSPQAQAQAHLKAEKNAD